MELNNNENYITYLEHFIRLMIFMIIGIFGTLSRLVMKIYGLKLTFIDIFLHIIATCFFASMIYILWTLIELPIQYGFILSGLTGFYGKIVFERFLKDKTGIDVSEDNKN